ncbi:hypothetical protein SAMN05216503_0390 [Polaribacter sp. KT25b]|nr:hypothetical protein SAMN05216503_0390 [Polaribacter sp. KT25b]
MNFYGLSKNTKLCYIIAKQIAESLKILQYLKLYHFMFLTIYSKSLNLLAAISAVISL